MSSYCSAGSSSSSRKSSSESSGNSSGSGRGGSGSDGGNGVNNSINGRSSVSEPSPTKARFNFFPDVTTTSRTERNIDKVRSFSISSTRKYSSPSSTSSRPSHFQASLSPQTPSSSSSSPTKRLHPVARLPQTMPYDTAILSHKNNRSHSPKLDAGAWRASNHQPSQGRVVSPVFMNDPVDKSPPVKSSITRHPHRSPVARALFSDQDESQMAPSATDNANDNPSKNQNSSIAVFHIAEGDSRSTVARRKHDRYAAQSSFASLVIPSFTQHLGDPDPMHPIGPVHDGDDTVDDDDFASHEVLHGEEQTVDEGDATDASVDFEAELDCEFEPDSLEDAAKGIEQLELEDSQDLGELEVQHQIDLQRYEQLQQLLQRQKQLQEQLRLQKHQRAQLLQFQIQQSAQDLDEELVGSSDDEFSDIEGDEN